MIQTFACPNCGAPLGYTGTVGAAVRCPYCASTVIVPDSLRPEPMQPPAASAGLDLAGMAGTLDLSAIEDDLRRLLQAGSKIEAIKYYRQVFGEGLKESKDAVEAFEDGEALRVPIGWGQVETLVDPEASRSLAQVAHLAQRGDRLAAIQLYRETFDSSLQEAQAVVEHLAQDVESDPEWVIAQVRADLTSSRLSRQAAPGIKIRKGSCLYASLSLLVIGSILVGLLAAVVQAVAPLRQTWENITPASFARLETSFGGKGSGPGLFSDPRAIAVGADGSIYVGNYTDGRIQRFDHDGRFLNQWFTQEEPYLSSLAVDRTGRVYAAYRGEIMRFDGSSGQALGALPNTDDLYFDYAVLTPDGGLLAVVDGEDLVRMDAEGQVQWRVAAALSSVSGDSELDTRLAVDGLGNIYALGIFNSAVFKYSPDGRFLNRWGSAGDQPGQLRAPDAIAVDGYGRVLVSDINGVQVFDGRDGRLIDRFDVPGVVFGMAFDEQNDLFAVGNDHKVFRYRLHKPGPMASIDQD